MKITMLYFDTVIKIIKEHDYTWDDVYNIQDYKGRVKLGEYDYTLEQIFYSTHMEGFDENGEHEKTLIESFLQALDESRNNRLNL